MKLFFAGCMLMLVAVVFGAVAIVSGPSQVVGSFYQNCLTVSGVFFTGSLITFMLLVAKIVFIAAIRRIERADNASESVPTYSGQYQHYSTRSMPSGEATGYTTAVAHLNRLYLDGWRIAQDEALELTAFNQGLRAKGFYDGIRTASLPSLGIDSSAKLNYFVYQLQGGLIRFDTERTAEYPLPTPTITYYQN